MNNIIDDAIPAEMRRLMQEAADRAAKGIRDPELVKRSRASMDRIRMKILKEHGILEIGAAAIRGLRDE